MSVHEGAFHVRGKFGCPPQPAVAFCNASLRCVSDATQPVCTPSLRTNRISGCQLAGGRKVRWRADLLMSKNSFSDLATSMAGNMSADTLLRLMCRVFHPTDCRDYPANDKVELPLSSPVRSLLVFKSWVQFRHVIKYCLSWISPMYHTAMVITCLAPPAASHPPPVALDTRLSYRHLGKAGCAAQ